MNSDLRKQAEELAARRYSMIVFRDTPIEDEPIYVALNPELDGCLAQGETSQEAQKNLDEFRVDFIHHLLTYKLPVPEPSWKRIQTERKILLEQPSAIILDGETDQQDEDLSPSGRIADTAVV